MSDNFVCWSAVMAKGLGALAATCCAGFLAYHGKDGWGWMIVLAIILGSFSVKTSKESNE